MTSNRVTVSIPGEWEDAWLYRGHLLAWDRAGTLWGTSTESLLRHIKDATDDHIGVLADLFILNSGRKASTELRDLLSISPIRRAVFSPWASTDEIVISIANVLHPRRLEPAPGNITDSVFYGNRLFCATDEGVYEAQHSARFDEPSELLQMTDLAASAVVAGNGAVSAALGESGLISRNITFGDGEDWARTAQQTTPRTLASYSRTVSRSGPHLLNYGSHAVPDFIRAHTRPDASHQGFTERMVTTFDAPHRFSESLEEVIGTSLEAGENTGRKAEVLGNAGYRLLVKVSDEVQVLNLSVKANKPLQLTPQRRFDFGGDAQPRVARTVATHALHSGFVIEHLAGAHIFDASGAIELTREMPVQVRTFPHSRRYDDTVVLIRDNALDLVGFARGAVPEH